MIDRVLTPGRTLALVCIALPVLFAILSTVGGNLEEGLRAQPPTEVEETDCRIEAMMSGDNPVEVETIHRACVQAANDADVAPRRARPRLLSGLLLVAYAGFAAALTVRIRSRMARVLPTRPGNPDGSRS